MGSVDLHYQALQRRWAEERRRLEARRQRLLLAAGRAAHAPRERRPGPRGVWVFGSMLQPDSIERHSDLDLALEARQLLAAALRLQSFHTGIEGSLVELKRPRHSRPLPQHPQQRLQHLRQRCLKAQPLAADRVVQSEGGGVQGLAG